MPLEGSYAIWNNYGGTGKTTFTYHLANKYALKHPDKTIVLIDMCPQADLSHAFLGDDENNLDYVSQIGTLKKDAMIIGEHKIPKTISGYLDLCTSIGLPQNIDPRTFLINVSKFNSMLPRNLYLLCGDPSIELVSRALELKRNSLTQFGTNAWKHITTCLKQFIKKIAERKGIKLVSFIDTNSAFSICTEIALCAADKLIIPINDDQLHRNAFEYMFALIYGFSHPSNVYYYYRHLSLYYRANEYDVNLPKIHLILNKITNTTNDNTNIKPIINRTSSPSPSSSSTSTSPRKQLNTMLNSNIPQNGYSIVEANTTNEKTHNVCWDFIFDLFQKHPQAFYMRSQNQIPKNLNEFKNEYVIDICTEQSTTNAIRQAVRSHSPLLTVKNQNNLQNGYSTQTSTSNSNILYANSHKSRITNPTRYLTNFTPINNLLVQNVQTKTSTTNLNNNEDTTTTISTERTIMFDKLLEKIVEKL